MPNETLAGLADTWPAVAPVPDIGMLNGELEASETIARLPLTAPFAAGLNFAVKVTLWLGATVAGSVNPLIEKPEPVTLACMIVSEDPPVLVNVSDVLLLAPTCTFPNA